MNAIHTEPILGLFFLGGWELVFLAAMMVFFIVIVSVVVGLIIYFTRSSDRNKGRTSPLPPAAPPIVPPIFPSAATVPFTSPIPPGAPVPAAPPIIPKTEVMPRQCPQCGAALKPDAPEGLCPACLLQRGIATEGGGAPAGGAGFVPPPVSELAALFPQLEIIECLGRGGMGAVYKARQPRLERLVALKILSPERQNDATFAERFGREARALARLNHPNIVAVYDFGEVQGRFYLLMEFVDGVTLRQVLSAGKLAPPEALKIVPKICEALQYAHEQGIIHRDIKPENILLDKLGRVKIADFGIAKITGLETKDPSLTRAQDVMGTPHYMAPEQVEQPLAVDHRADIYSLGVVFYEMLTGELPLGKFALPSQKASMDLRLDQVVMHALEKEPAQRYQQASEVKTDVETIAGGASASGMPGVGVGGIGAGAGRAAGIGAGAGAKMGSAPTPTPEPIRPATPSTVSDKVILPAFLLSFFGVFGVHRFYVGKIRSGLVQLGALIGCMLLIIICATSDGRGQPELGLMLGFLILGCVVWAVIDWILILCKAFTDGEGKRLTHWTQPEIQPEMQPVNPMPSAGNQSRSETAGSVPPGMTGSTAGGGPAYPPVLNALVPVDNRMLITAPAVALMVAAAWNILRSFTSMLLFAGGNQWLAGFMGGFNLLGGLTPLTIGGMVFLSMIPSGLILFGGYQMLQRRSYAWSIAGGIMAILFCSLFGFPAGVWALIILARTDTQAAFREAAAARSPANRSANQFANRSTILVIGLITGLLLLAALGAAILFWSLLPRRHVAFPGAVSRFQHSSQPWIPAIPSMPAMPAAPAMPSMPTLPATPAGLHLENGEYVMDFDESFPLTDRGTFQVDNVNGRIEIHGWDSNSVAVHARIHDRKADNVNNTRIDVDAEADQVTLHTAASSEQADSFFGRLKNHVNGKDVATVDYDIQVPQNVRLENVSSVNGHLKIDGVTGDLTASTVNGPMDIKDADGNLNLSTVNGQMRVVMAALGNGQQVNVNAVNGQLVLAVPEDADAGFTMNTLSGSITSEFPALPARQNFPVGTELKGNLGNGSATVKATAVSGSFKIIKRPSDHRD